MLTVTQPCYFLISVSTRHNLDLCVKHGLAGFPSSTKGAWTFEEVREGDFISFLYGARAYNLYKIVRRHAIRNADALPPWPRIISKISGKSYSFPFRLSLEPVRIFAESLVRAEFAYVAENLLLRGGYRKTHFQADQTTLQSVSEMGDLARNEIEGLALPTCEEFTPLYTRSKSLVRVPEVLRFEEIILQAALRHHLLDEENLDEFLRNVDIQPVARNGLEVLGEKALPEGHVDVLLKERVPLGSATKIVLEVKLNNARLEDISQLRGYMDQFGGECVGAILVAGKFGKQIVREASAQAVKLLQYRVDADWTNPLSFDDICRSLRFEAA